MSDVAESKIVIVDFGMGNLRSLQSKLKMIQVDSVVSADPSVIAGASKLILPGVGHFAMGMKNIRERGLLDVLNQKVLKEKTPILGICLGMQLLGKHSEEGNVDGLGWIDFKNVKFKFDTSSKRFRVPHVGWNSIKISTSAALVNSESKSSDHQKLNLLRDVPLDTKPFYFTHSYHAVAQDKSAVLTTTDYGFEFVSSVQKENIYGTQFHPEKSRLYGLKILENFVRHC
jgi:glutamine amidotransferase